MRWQETVASKCRYGDVAERFFENADIIYDGSESGYQGEVNVIALMPNGDFVHFEYTYGSCSGCDDWECRDLSDDQIAAEMVRSFGVLPDADAMLKYLNGVAVAASNDWARADAMKPAVAFKAWLDKQN